MTDIEKLERALSETEAAWHEAIADLSVARKNCDRAGERYRAAQKALNAALQAEVARKIKGGA